MLALHWLLPVFFSALALAAPASRPMPIGASKIKYPVVPPLLLCDIPFVNKVFCPIRRASAVTVKTPLGSAAGVADGGATRFVVQYGQAPRWGASKPAAKWALPNNLTDASGSPLACPQLGVDAATTAEDCLSAILYVPPGLSASSGAPTMVWIHGGSFTSGSATAPGLDGAKLAVATKAVVAVVQYRLGGLGWLAPNGAASLGAQDVVTALQFLNGVLPAFGGAPGKITLAGQSSGGTLIRALLAAPAAAPLFQSAIIQSDPMDYGFYTPAIQAQLTADFATNLGCAQSDAKCLSALSVSDILNAADSTVSNAGEINAAASGGEALRPVRDGAFISATLDGTGAFAPQNKPLLLTTVANEAAYTIYGGFNAPVSSTEYDAVVGGSYSTAATNTILASTFYSLPASFAANTSADARPQLQVLGTDGVWRCPTWTFARAWAKAGAKAYVAEWRVGASYPGNSAVPQCALAGAVCHQDDIELVFGTAPSPSAAQTAAIAEAQARYAAFLHTGGPNAAGYAAWTPAGASAVGASFIGAGSGGSAVPDGGCSPSLWGTPSLPYDYQVYNL